MREYFKTITFVQGSEFFRYNWLKKILDIDIFFNPHSPHQKRAIQNANGLLRVHCPRSMDIGLVSQNRIDGLVRNINNRPMKCLNYHSAKELFNIEMAR